MTRSLVTLPRWLLALEMTVCLVPLTLLFVAILTNTARGLMAPATGMLYGSAALVGPLGLAVALRLTLFAQRSVSVLVIVALALLSLWTVLACSGQVLHDGAPFSGSWQDFVLIAVLPMLAVIHLIHINSDRRAAPVPG